MAIRSYGKCTKIAVQDHLSVLQFDLNDSEDLGSAEELNEPIVPEIDFDLAMVDEILTSYDFGNGVRAEARALPADRDDPLIIDIDDGRPDPPRKRLGALKRVINAPRTIQKFNRHTGSWE